MEGLECLDCGSKDYQVVERRIELYTTYVNGVYVSEYRRDKHTETETYCSDCGKYNIDYVEEV